MAWLNLFPPYLIVLTLVFVIFPTVLALGIRITLYKYLQESGEKVKRLIRGDSRGIQPKIISNLEERFKKASSKLDYVNTSALVDGLYSDERFTFFSKSLRCEQWDYFGKVLPNLLLAFGLLGTFLGITLNLTGISTLISLGSTDNSNLVAKLQEPLQSMGIAFITSLIALVFSSFLTVINLLFNTNVAKMSLISSLEDYLDNILQPEIEGKSRLDRAVNRMVDRQNDFLTNFHNNVTRVVESSLGKVAKQIADGNIEAANLAKQVYEQLTATSGTLGRGAEVFFDSTLRLEEQVKSLKQIVQHENFVKYSEKLDNSVSSFQGTIDKIIQGKVADKLLSATQSLDLTQKHFSDTVQALNQLSQLVRLATENMNNSIDKITSTSDQIQILNQQSSKLLEQNQQSSTSLVKTIEKATTSLQKSNTNLSEATNAINDNSGQFNTLGDELIEVILQESGRNNDQHRILAEKTEQTAGYLREIQILLNQILVLANQQNNSRSSTNSF